MIFRLLLVFLFGVVPFSGIVPGETKVVLHSVDFPFDGGTYHDYSRGYGCLLRFC